MRLLVSPVMPSGAAGIGYAGVVEVDGGGCFAVGGAALVGLPGSTLNDDGSFTLVNPGGLTDAATFRVGDRYELGGTLVHKDATFVQPYLPDGARSCGSKKVLLVFGG